MAGHARTPGSGPPGDGGGRDEAQLSAVLAELARIPGADETWTAGLRPGDEVGRFVVQRELGRGGFGLVYEAFDTKLRRGVAFKAVRPGTRRRNGDDALVRAEAEAVARLNHPNIVTLHELDRCAAGPYLIFELLHGETLAGRLRRGPLPLRDAVEVAVEVARALAHAHRADVVHRDLKPANVFLCDGGGVKVLDFGLAYLFGHAPASGGTPSYMAPEQWRSEPGDARTDLFALGVLVHHMLTGELPYRVSNDRSEALEPGPPPILPKGAAPSVLRSVVARLLAKSPADRPQTAQEVLDALLPIQRRLPARIPTRRLAWALLLALAVAAALAIAWYFVRGPGAHDDRGAVVLADVENGTGDAALASVSGMLITSLEQSRHVDVLSRSRMIGLLRHLRLDDTRRIDAKVGRELARLSGATVLLVGSAERVGSEYDISLRAVDAVHDRRLFEVTVRAPGKDAVPDALDRLSEDTRRRLGEREDDIRAARIRLRDAVTPSVDAYEHYFAGLGCVERPSVAGSWASVRRCAEHFERALALDPTFALAHYQLAFLFATERGTPAEIAEHISAALRYAARTPPKESALVRALKRHVDGDDAGAFAEYAMVLERFREDKQALYLVGDLHFHRGEYAAAVPFFEKLRSLDPGAEWPLDHLVNALGVGRRDDALRRIVAALDAEAPTPARVHAIVRARVWLGEPAAAIETARRAVAAGVGAAAEADLTSALLSVGDFAQVEARQREAIAAGPFDPAAYVTLASALAGQGRRTEGLRVLATAAARAGAANQAVLQFVRAMYVAGGDDARALWREASRARALRPGDAPTLAVVLALRGDLRHARELVRGLAPGTPAAEELEALVSWRRGDAAGAIARLAALDVRDPSPDEGLAPSYLLAEVASATGDHATADAAARRFQALWARGPWRGWAYPRSVYLGALAAERLGDVDRARAELRRLLAAWERADPDLSTLREARALAARLGP